MTIELIKKEYHAMADKEIHDTILAKYPEGAYISIMRNEDTGSLVRIIAIPFDIQKSMNSIREDLKCDIGENICMTHSLDMLLNLSVSIDRVNNPQKWEGMK